MHIKDIFSDDIQRKINGVVKVDEDTSAVLAQELDEYVITKDLRKHFTTFFDAYEQTIGRPSSDIGVWISGFFGSGKSHFLKMLSYLLSNEEVLGVPTVERFRNKFEDDPATFMLIEQATRGTTETILFNIDVEGSSKKDKTAVLRVFAKMFFEHQGFYGEDLKLAKLEQFIDKRGKTQEFRQMFEEISGRNWLEHRKAFSFYADHVITCMTTLLDMSEEACNNWFNGTETADISIASLVAEMKDYVASKPDDYRLIFMADEVGQYVGADTDLLLNLQSLIEKIGTECAGKVWVICTGQEAIDEIIKARENEFSRIQARFAIRLSLTSSSADEVIQKRLLSKTPEATRMLQDIYDCNEAALRNIYSFKGALQDIKGYSGSKEFIAIYPFVPYQFVILQKAFTQIRKHGNSGKNLSAGERSMLSGFQEAAQLILDRDEYSLAPFYLFYDTVHGFLDQSIRSVVERCEKAAENGYGIEPYDLDVLKLLYMIRYIDDIPANLDNIIVLMADDIRVDKVVLRNKVKDSLDRLVSQNYIARMGEVYNFLTDEEQDVQREIFKNTQVDTAEVVEKIANFIRADIYKYKKFRYCNTDLPFEIAVDGKFSSNAQGVMRVNILSIASDFSSKNELSLLADSTNMVVIVMDDLPYFELLERREKVDKYAKQRNLPELPKTVQAIIYKHQTNAASWEEEALEYLKQAIHQGDFYIAGERIDIKGADAQAKINEALEYLANHVYSELSLITKNAQDDNDIARTLQGRHLQGVMPGMEDNRDAAAKVEEYLEIQSAKRLPTTMADIQQRYQGIPYGWREIDIAQVVAMLIFEQKLTIKYGGEVIAPSNPKLPGMLRKRSEISKTSVARRQLVSAQKIAELRAFLDEYFNAIHVPEKEDELISYALEQFETQELHYKELMAHYAHAAYPDKPLVEEACDLSHQVLSQRSDNMALVDKMLQLQDDLLDNKEDMERVEGFFKSQVPIFDEACSLINKLAQEEYYLQSEQEAYRAYEAIADICNIATQPAPSIYRRIPELNELMTIVGEGHDRLVAAKRSEVLAMLQECQELVAAKALDLAEPYDKLDYYVQQARSEYARMKEQLLSSTSLAVLDGLGSRAFSLKDQQIAAMERSVIANTAADASELRVDTPALELKTVYRSSFSSCVLKTPADVDSYVEEIRHYLITVMQDCDGIKLS